MDCEIQLIVTISGQRPRRLSTYIGVTKQGVLTESSLAVRSHCSASNTMTLLVASYGPILRTYQLQCNPQRATVCPRRSVAKVLLDPGFSIQSGSTGFSCVWQSGLLQRRLLATVTAYNGEKTRISRRPNFLPDSSAFSGLFPKRRLVRRFHHPHCCLQSRPLDTTTSFYTTSRYDSGRVC